ncbi:hypothetical protein HNQ03_001545 [Chryseobacterium sp. 16F]|uniref:Uncharacterized protein n=1 Tax=Frigoriflavimonas asaccharolytica TaxID=2735899 RepID=A0A8J8GAN5_9FLAO|nr:hypothetical protein [Frigoriflavimonas asaccharolytica]
MIFNSCVEFIVQKNLFFLVVELVDSFVGGNTFLAPIEVEILFLHLKKRLQRIAGISSKSNIFCKILKWKRFSFKKKSGNFVV